MNFIYYLTVFLHFNKYLTKLLHYFSTMYCIVYIFLYIFALSCYRYETVVNKKKNYENYSKH